MIYNEFQNCDVDEKKTRLRRLLLALIFELVYKSLLDQYGDDAALKLCYDTAVAPGKQPRTKLEIRRIKKVGARCLEMESVIPGSIAIIASTASRV